MPSSVKANLLDDGVVDTLGLVGMTSSVHTSDDGESTSAKRVAGQHPGTVECHRACLYSLEVASTTSQTDTKV
jgi:hypothetical protein